MIQAHQKSPFRRGFTLVEMLVVVLVLATLIAVALPSYLNSFQNSKVITANSNAQSLATAIKAAGTVEGSFSANPLSDSLTLNDLGNVIPANPCNNDLAGNNPADWSVNVVNSKQVTVQANVAAFSNCGSTTLYTISL